MKFNHLKSEKEKNILRPNKEIVNRVSCNYARA